MLSYLHVLVKLFNNITCRNLKTPSGQRPNTSKALKGLERPTYPLFAISSIFHFTTVKKRTKKGYLGVLGLILLILALLLLILGSGILDLLIEYLRRRLIIFVF